MTVEASLAQSMHGTCSRRRRVSVIDVLAMTAMIASVSLAVPLRAAPHDPRSSNAPGACEITVDGSTDTVRFWPERTPDGRQAMMYRFTIDGRESSRPLEATNLVRLRQADFDPLIHQPAIAADLMNEAANLGHNQQRVYIVQFVIPPLESMLDQLRTLGATPHIFLPDQSFLVRMSPAAREEVAALPSVRWVGEYHPAHKLDQPLIDALAADANSLQEQVYSIEVFERGLRAGAGQLAVAERIAVIGGTVHSTSAKGFRMQAMLSGPQVLDIVRMPEVQFVHELGDGAGPDMNIAREIGGATPLLSGLGFTGQGVRGEVMDGGILATHAAFQSPAPIIHGPVAGPPDQQHGTNTYGCVFGNGTANSAGTGLLPNREQGIFADYDQLTSLGGTVDRYDHTEELVDPSGPYRVVFQSNSWGNSLTTQYNTLSAEFDDILFTYDLVACQSQSNTGTTLSRPEAWSKNAVTIGGVAHFNSLGRGDDSWTAASFGPAADGRVKPDLTHFYDAVTCPTSTSDTSYTTAFGGTSAATPIVAGYFGIVFQMWHEGVFSGFGGGASVFASRPHMSTAKAMIINSSYRYNWLAGGSNADLTRDKQGWGMPDAGKLYNDRAKTLIINETELLLPGGVRSYQVNVMPGQPEFRATLVYTDPKGNTPSSVHRINDLSLQVVSPSNVTYWGNFGLWLGNDSVAGGGANVVDTVENVFLQNPQPGVWTVKVFGDVIVQDAHVETPALDADFALVVVGGIPKTTPCLGDINDSGAVNIDDLVALVINWGAPGGPADINSDNIVNIDDLVALIGNWGPCP